MALITNPNADAYIGGVWNRFCFCFFFKSRSRIRISFQKLVPPASKKTDSESKLELQKCFWNFTQTLQLLLLLLEGAEAVLRIRSKHPHIPSIKLNDEYI
ncbi:unnamed protein product [Cuscuta epithymum]|uniref:Uncharacterized protein n=1 Tax=Cuscuta epithymum TaxID=186058 RepID=A0AAV0E2H0_9ASTE|nr:unnamed protein product [Cuscuta epithymum]